jgi:hypothetical protein
MIGHVRRFARYGLAPATFSAAVALLAVGLPAALAQLGCTAA